MTRLILIKWLQVVFRFFSMCRFSANHRLSRTGRKKTTSTFLRRIYMKLILYGVKRKVNQSFPFEKNIQFVYVKKFPHSNPMTKTILK